jgi:hypothetical protein
MNKSYTPTMRHTLSFVDDPKELPTPLEFLEKEGCPPLACLDDIVVPKYDMISEFPRWCYSYPPLEFHKKLASFLIG